MVSRIIQTIRTQGLGLLRSRGQRQGQSAADPEGTRADFAQGREDERQAHMSAEDRAWEAASLQRNRDAQERQNP
ncbi:MAG: hypothetical protein M3R02_15660 [Chloroflexota bacterium]|nr:hypothetical protein [Chloroflexota bacterium]